jgi:hypothetical protein
MLELNENKKTYQCYLNRSDPQRFLIELHRKRRYLNSGNGVCLPVTPDNRVDRFSANNSCKRFIVLQESFYAKVRPDRTRSVLFSQEIHGCRIRLQSLCINIIPWRTNSVQYEARTMRGKPTAEKKEVKQTCGIR